MMDAKIMDLHTAVERLVRPDDVVGLGGQNINRCPMALVHEVIRQGQSGLTVVGCNLSLPLDLLAAAGQLVATEQGSGNLERYGVLFEWRRQAESGQITVTDYSHLAMASRFLGGSLGIGFMPVRSLLGTDMAKRLVAADHAREHVDPWTGQPVLLLRGLAPDVSLIHASQADAFGNVIIDGVTSHEIDMVKASRRTIVTVEQIVGREAFASHPESVSISGAFVDAVVEQEFGAFPTSVYRYYDYCEPEIQHYQERSRAGGTELKEYLAEWIYQFESFEYYLRMRDPDGLLREELEASMRSLV